MQRIVALVVLSRILGGSLAEAQTASRFRLIDSDSVTTSQLARVVREGYRVSPDATVAPGFLILERTGEKREYLVSDTLLEDAARDRIPHGFRILPRSVRAFAYRRNRKSECAAILERSPGDRRRRDYRVEHSVQHRTLRTDILKGVAEGFRPLVVAAGMSGFCTVMERESPANDVTNRTSAGARGKESFVLIGASRTAPLEREYQDAVADGYRLHSKVIGELIYLMELQDEPVPSADDVILSHFRADTFHRELNERAARGYRLHAYSIGISDTPLDDIRAQIHAVMEKRASSPVEYWVIGRGVSQDMFKRELVTAGEEGWELTTTLGSGLIIMQRPAKIPFAR
jgi:hypothetical protein